MALDPRRMMDAIQQQHEHALQVRLGARVDKQVRETLGQEYAQRVASIIQEIPEVMTTARHHLDESVRTANTVEKVGDGALAALTGGGAGALAYTALNKTGFGPNLIGRIENFMGLTHEGEKVPQVATGVLSAALGTLVTKVMYDELVSSQTGDIGFGAEDFHSFIQQHQRFSTAIKNKCDQLAQEIVKLFHFREMLLTNENQLRDNLKAKIDIDDDRVINCAIETFFLEQLSKQFNTAFEELYNTQNAVIRDQQDQDGVVGRIKNWFHRFFESKSQRNMCTQKIQLEFMLLTKDFLIAEMNEPSFFAKHKFASVTVPGLIAGTVVIAALALGGPITWGIAALSLVAFAVTSFISFIALKKINRLKYKRGQANRDAIQAAAKNVEDEFSHLDEQIKAHKETSSADIEKAKAFAKVEHGEHGLLATFKTVDNIACGSPESWLRDYALRYRHSEAIAVDLRTHYIELYQKAQRQIDTLVVDTDGRDQRIEAFVTATRMYLANPEHKATIDTFNIKQKIKEQILDISVHIGNGGEYLCELYKELGGDVSDIREAIELTVFEQLTPYSTLLTTKDNLEQHKRDNYHNKDIFNGDTTYRTYLGMAAIDPLNVATLTTESVTTLLKNSHDFLLSLLPDVEPGILEVPLNNAIRKSPAFNLYRMLLLKQLAHLCEPVQSPIKPDVRQTILDFVSNNLGIDDAEMMFNNLSNERWLEPTTTDPDIRHNGKFLQRRQLDLVAQTVRLDIAYNSTPLSAQYVIDVKIAEKMQDKSELFYHGDADHQLLPPYGDPEYVERVARYIENTREFLDRASNDKSINQNGILNRYQQHVSMQAYQILLQITQSFKNNVAEGLDVGFRRDNLKELHKAFKAVYEFTNELRYKIQVGDLQAVLNEIYQLNNLEELNQLPHPVSDYALEQAINNFPTNHLQDTQAQVEQPPQQQKRRVNAFSFYRQQPIEGNRQQGDKAEAAQPRRGQ